MYFFLKSKESAKRGNSCEKKEALKATSAGPVAQNRTKRKLSATVKILNE